MFLFPTPFDLSIFIPNSAIFEGFFPSFDVRKGDSSIIIPYCRLEALWAVDVKGGGGKDFFVGLEEEGVMMVYCRVAFPISPINSQQKKTLNLEKEAFSANIFIDKFTDKNIVLFHFLTGAWIMANFVLYVRCRKAPSK